MIKSLSSRLLMICCLCLALPLLVNSFISFNKQYLQQLEEGMHQLTVTTDYRAFEAIHAAKENTLLLDQVIDMSYLFAEHSLQEVTPFLQLQSVALSEFLDIRVLEQTHQGYLIRVSSHDDLGSVFQDHLIEEMISSQQLKTLTIQNGALFLIDIRYLYPHDHTHILVATIPLHMTLQRILNREYLENQPIHFLIQNQSGHILFATDPQLQGDHLNLSSSTEGIPMFPLSKPHFFNFSYDNSNYLMYSTEFVLPDFQLGAYVNKIILFQYSLQEFFVLYIAYGSIFIIGMILSIFLTQWMNIPYKNLVDTIFAAYHKDWRSRYHPTRFGFEFNYLGELFNHSCDSLENNLVIEQEQLLKQASLEQEIELGKTVQKNFLYHQSFAIPTQTFIKGEEYEQFFLDQFQHHHKTFVTFGLSTLHGTALPMFLTQAQALAKGYLLNNTLEAGFRALMRDLHKDFVSELAAFHCALFEFADQNVRISSTLDTIYQLHQHTFEPAPLGQVIPCDQGLALLISSTPFSSLYPYLHQNLESHLHRGCLLLITP